MGFFDKAKAKARETAAAAQQGLHQPVDTAIFGGPSNRPVNDDDPIWEPINGISLEEYAALARAAQARRITDEAGMIALAQDRGWDPTEAKVALDGWVQRMGQSMAVGQKFRQLLGY